MATLLRSCRLNLIKKNNFSASSASTDDFKFKKFDLIGLSSMVEADPHFGKEGVKKNFIPDTLGYSVGKQRFEAIANLYGEDPYDPKVKLNRYSTAKTPNLFPTFEEKHMVGCICNNEQPGAFYKVLYKDMLTRCHCGHWMLAVSYEEYYKNINTRREERYTKIKSTPLVKALETDLDKHEADFLQLCNESQGMDSQSEDSYEMKGKMKETFNGYLTLRKSIEELLDLAQEELPDLNVVAAPAEKLAALH